MTSKEMVGRYCLIGNTVTSMLIFSVGHRQLTATSCDGQIMQLTCSDKYISIDKVFYGREDTTGEVCPTRFSNHSYSACETDSTADDVVREKCEGNKACDIDVQTDLWDVLDANGADACPNEYKYLQVSYSCEKFIEGKT